MAKYPPEKPPHRLILSCVLKTDSGNSGSGGMRACALCSNTPVMNL